VGKLVGWSRRQKITIDHNKIDSDLSNFPVKVILSSDNPFFDKVQLDGRDVRFTAIDGITMLDFEREVHDNNKLIAVYHVKIPLVSSTVDTDFYMYYDNPNASDASSPNDVWDSNYKLVMHMGPSLEDSTSNGNDGTNYGTTLGLASDGYYRSFDGVDDYVLISNLGNTTMGDMTFSCWMNRDEINVRDIVFGNYVITQDVNLFNFEIHTDNHARVYWLKPPSLLDVRGSTVVPNKQWILYLFVRDTTNSKWYFYLNGQLADTLNGAGVSFTDARDHYIGRDTRTGHTALKGKIAEVRISSTARSDAWIKATSASLHNALLTFGDEETVVRPRVQVVFI